MQVGYYGQFIILQFRLKEAARSAWLGSLPDGQLSRISLADVEASGKWEEAGRECWFHDHLYDVIRRKDIDGRAFLFCIDDEREAPLIRQSSEVTRVNLDHPGQKANHHSMGKMGDILIEAGLIAVRPVPCVPGHTLSFDENILPFLYAEIVVPPPRAGADAAQARPDAA